MQTLEFQIVYISSDYKIKTDLPSGESCHWLLQFVLGTLCKTAEDGDGNVGKTIRLITQDKKRT